MPQQALAMINSGMVSDSRQRDRRCRSTARSGSDSSAEVRFVDSAFERVFGRAPTEAERADARPAWRAWSGFASEEA